MARAETMKEITLFFAGIDTSPQLPDSVSPEFDRCIVTGGDMGDSVLFTVSQEIFELDDLVAHHAGVGREAFHVSFDERGHHVSGKSAFQIQKANRDLKVLPHPLDRQGSGFPCAGEKPGAENEGLSRPSPAP
jgi:hypothetical protein